MGKNKFNKIVLLIAFLILCFKGSSQVRSGISAFMFKPSLSVGYEVGPNFFVADSFGRYFLTGNWGMTNCFHVGYDVSDILSGRLLFGMSTVNWPNALSSSIDDKSFKAQQLGVELFYNLSNKFNFYNLYRPFDLSIFAGAGMIMREKSSFQREYTGYLLKGGMQLLYRVNFNLDVNVNGSLNLMPELFDGAVSGEPFNALPELKIGFTYHLRNTTNY